MAPVSQLRRVRPGEVGEPLKIDLLQPLASARLVLHPYEDLYSISFQEKGGMLLGMKSLGCLGGAELEMEGTKKAGRSMEIYGLWIPKLYLIIFDHISSCMQIKIYSEID